MKHEPAIQNGKLHHISVSQINAWDLCGRRYWYPRVGGQPPEPQSRQQGVGVAVHEQLEHYLKTGEDVLSPMEQPGVPFLPTPARPGELYVEQRLEDPAREPFTIDGVPVYGGIDFYDLAPLRRGEGWIDLGDHKTSSDPESYAKPTSWLETDTQGIVYAAWLLREYPEAREVRYRHITYSTGSRPYAIGTGPAVFTVDRVRELMLTVKQKVTAIRRAVETTDAEQIPANTESCHAFRKACPYLGVCNAWLNRTSNPFAAFSKGVTKMGTLDRFRTALPTPAAPTAVATTPATTPPTSPPAPTTPPATQPPATFAPPTTDAASSRAPSPGVNPPDAPPELDSETERAAASARAAIDAAPAPAPVDQPTRRKRRTKSEMDADGAAAEREARYRAALAGQTEALEATEAPITLSLADVAKLKAEIKAELLAEIAARLGAA